jgi:hypothetical protein
LACEPCNIRKGSILIEKFLGGDPERLARINARRRAPLDGAAAVNTARFAIVRLLKIIGLPVSCWTGGRTKFNRASLRLPKAHWIDAACVGKNGGYVIVEPAQKVSKITATGRGSRQACRVDRFGFPRTAGKRAKRVHDLSSNDLVRLTQPHGKYAGVHVGYVAIRERGDFDLKVGKVKITSSARRFALIQRADGYRYAA